MSRYLPSQIILSWLVFNLVLAPVAQAADYVWLEGETPTSTNLKPNISGWGRKELLSKETWLQVAIEAGNVEKELPPDGGLMAYEFNLGMEGTYEVWNRIGYEFVRSPFDWRMDGGEWARIGPEALTTDLMELQVWNEVAWLKLGEKPLAAGPHKLEIRLPKTQDEKGKTARVLYASDALCIHLGEFHPNGKFKPDENYRTAEDEESARKVFDLPEPAAAGARLSVALEGLWEAARHDEQAPGEIAAPIADFPKQPHWRALRVPGDKNKLRPDLIFCHRLWYRTRVNVPASQAGRSFFIVFPQNNLNTTVAVNGVLCGFNKNPFARFEIDVTKGVKPGINEVWVGIRDAYYGFSTKPNDPMKLRRKFNYPLEWANKGFMDLAYPVWNHFHSGILATPEFVSAGPVRSTEVFCKPSVARRELAIELTLTNPSAKDASGEIQWAAVNAKTGEVEKTFTPKPFTLAAGASQALNLAEAWDNPKLWWPDEPNLYRLQTTAKLAGQAVDIAETTFGFREWTSGGRNFKLNGIVWHGWADCFAAPNPDEWLRFYRLSNQRVMRFWGTTWQGLSPDKALDFFDRHGVVCRRSGILDGEMIGYMAIENDPDLKKLHNSEIKVQLMENWRDQLVAQVKGERNHPSVLVWSIENEWLYINCINLYGGLMDKFEAEVTKTSEAVRSVDPTRFTMVDGGGATKAQTLPVHGDHYVFGPNDTRYPALAYETNPAGGGRGRWVWDEQRPRFIGEDYFANGINPADYSIFGGEATFVGKAQARPAAGIIFRLLTEGYRWAEFGAWHFWMGQHEAVNQYNSNAPLAVFCRQWDWTFGSGQKVNRTFGIFNDTRSNEPVTFEWTIKLEGKKVGGGASTHEVPAGTSKRWDEVLEMPKVEKREEAELAVTLTAGAEEVFRDVKAVSVLPIAGANSLVCPICGQRGDKLAACPHGARLSAAQLLVFDPSNSVAAFLKSINQPFTTLPDLKTLPETGKVLIIGKDALDTVESTSSRLAAWASVGRSVIVLEQKNPLRYQGLPAEMEPSTVEGRIAYIEDLNHPALAGLKHKDFFTWGPDEILYRNAYVKPTRGGKSLVQCHARLQHTALAEVPVGKGLLLLSQLVVGEKLASNAVAQQLLPNLIAHGATYRLEYRKAVVALRDSGNLPKILEAIGLQHTAVEDPLAGISTPGIQLAVIEASPANLKALAGNLPKVKQFTAGGGYIVLHGLTPDGLADYNRIVGYEHILRPFRRERVLFPPSKHPLTSGLTTGDIVMLSGERIFGWTSDEYVASDIFSFIVDFDEVAPFAEFPSDYFHNMVNGFVSADAWKYIFSFEKFSKQSPPTFTMKLPKPEEFVEFEWIGNAFYHLVTKVEMWSDGDEANKVTFDTQPNNEPQTFTIEPARKGKDVTIRLADWQEVPGKGNVVGVDNLRLKVKRPPEFYERVKPLLNLGALMEYPDGPGGIVLCNLLFKEAESVPINLTKKRTILATLLRNLRAPFSGQRSVIAGANLQYQSIDISQFAKQYRDEKGWFGDKNFTFKNLPIGKQSFAGVPYQVYEFATSPVPTVIMLGGPGVPNNPPQEVRGIPVNQKADALFFLHTARLDARRHEQEIKQGKKYEMFRYVVTYADGQTANVPIYGELDIDDYRQKSPRPIPGAQIAWTRPYEGTEFAAVAYSKQWNNPRPDVEIKSLDILYGEHRRGVPAVLAITAATVQP